MATSFLGGAGSRLLPPSIPFRFFISATVFHGLAWLVLFFGADDLAGYSGGPGLILAAIHLLTLGVLAMAALGASYQLLPVVTRQPLARNWPATLSFWLFAPGVPVLAFGMVNATATAMNIGGGLVFGGLAIFVVLTLDNLRRASEIPVVAAHGWAAMLALLGLLGLGLMLILSLESGILGNHRIWAEIHMILAIFGFMGLLVLGFSQVLIPMFVLATPPNARLGWLQLVMTLAAIILFSLAKLYENPDILACSAILALGAGATYVFSMIAALKTSMRKRHGKAFWLIKSSWGFLMLALLVGTAPLLGIAIPNGGVLFGFLALLGWLLTFLLGVLQRILPFLASMHGAGKTGRVPLLSDLTPELPLNIHVFCHFCAILCGAVGIVLEITRLMQFAAIVGLLGAVAFSIFSFLVLLRMSRPRP